MTRRSVEHTGHRPLRVLQVLGTSAGGVARHVQQVAAGLGGAEGPDEVPVTVRVAGPHSVVAGLDGAVPVEISDRPRPGDVAAVLRLRALCTGADVVHAHGLRAGALSVCAARSVPRGRRPRIVVTLHNKAVGSRATRAVAALLETVVARGADVVLGVSSDLVAALEVRGARRTARALVPAPARRPATEPAAAVREGLGIDLGAPMVLTVGRLAPQKDLGTVLEAAGELAHDPAAAGLVWAVAGDGPLHGELEARIAELALPVRLLGARDDVPDLLAAADVVVSTALWEGQPIGVQEALAAGAAVVATDAGGTREVTGERGAVLVDVGDGRAVAREVARLLADSGARAELGGRARERAAELPGLDDVVRQLRDVYTR